MKLKTTVALLILLMLFTFLTACNTTAGMDKGYPAKALFHGLSI